MFIYSIDTQSYNKRRKGLSQIFLTSKKKLKIKKTGRQLGQATYLFLYP